MGILMTWRYLVCPPPWSSSRNLENLIFSLEFPKSRDDVNILFLNQVDQSLHRTEALYVNGVE